MAVITNEKLIGIKDQIAARNAKLKRFVEMYAANTWDNVQLDVRSMSRAALLAKYPIGTEMICEYNYNGNAYEYPWIVGDVRDVEWQDGTIHQGLWLLSKYGTIESIQFDAPEAVETDDTVAQAGVYYFYKNGADFVLLSVATGETLPTEHGQLYKHRFNQPSILRYGYNNYKDSAVRQWLTSEAIRGEWWAAQHDYDVAPDQATTEDGFLYRLDPELVSVLTPIKISVSANTVTDGGRTDVMYDKVFLQSLEEVYGSPQAAGIEGAYVPWWKDATGYSSPTSGSSSNVVDARKIKKLNAQSGAAVYAWLRSALRGNANGAWSFSTTGYLYANGANTSLTPLPACVIS